nr:alpha/beta hydrolase family protein [Nocardia terpenica]
MHTFPTPARSRLARSGTAAALAAMIALGASAPAFGADIPGTRPARIDTTQHTGARTERLQVYSPAMDRDITVEVQPAADRTRPHPVLYLLNGGGGGEDGATWQQNTDVLNFLASKNVTVVQPVGGQWSYYTDWRAPDPVLGVNKWATFLTRELPPVIDAAYDSHGVNAIAGLSMSGTSVLQLAVAEPGLYRAVAAFSGCARVSDPMGQTFIRLTVETWGHGDTTNMYGPPDDPMWAANDPYLHADRLRGTKLFLATGTGLPGRHDSLGGPHIKPGPNGYLDQVLGGGAIEAAVNRCTQQMRDRLNALGIPATYNFDSTGTHSWGYWQDDFRRAWPTLADGLGIAR